MSIICGNNHVAVAPDYRDDEEMSGEELLLARKRKSMLLVKLMKYELTEPKGDLCKRWWATWTEETRKHLSNYKNL
jgi:hypothetical protein